MRRLLLTFPLIALCAWAPPAGASSRQVTTFEAPRELLSGSTRATTLDQISQFGVKRVRQLVYWRDIAPEPDSKTKPAGFDASNPDSYPANKWDNLDGLVAAARERKIDVTLTLTGPVPRWATKGKRDNYTDPLPAEFGAFATAIGRRYGDAVNLWSVWNEPNQPQFLRPQFKSGKAYSPKLYRKLYQAAERGLRSTPANAKDTLLIAETSPRGNSNIVAPLAFLRGMLCLDSKYRKSKSCGKLEPGGYAHHAYTTSAGPRWVPQNADDVTIGVLPRLVTALDKAARAGALPKHLPIHLTEFGIQTEPDKISGVSLERQAAYLAVSEHIAYVNPRVAAFSQYLMSDDPPRSSGYRYGGFESGLKSADGKEKPAFNGFRLPLAVEAYGNQDVLWGLVRPQRAVSKVTIERRITGYKTWRVLKTIDTTASGVYALKTPRKKGQHYRVKWTSPSGTTYTGPSVRSY
ncbi:cellulase family glycosylhydrolase [Solirubrobacter sp. CPCC 204708]|uniref:Cellulase family glycosylhydrolase n=1 Tax=Solirubrobacter deserti TaxID=2282478 RepID=A0ABT4RF55_9ACTN|nr:cellulase family glycosylhydrolase [Solirubrobacter deserti]MBE2318487.1 cellulase family glycosylhydrolase [Solirubrobacter deserti]MDA0136945.1 cellulase family glycosylhydrolase [Solirubrobacter deserti]